MAIARVAERVRAGGHHIPEATIRQRYAQSVRNFLDLFRPLADVWQVYDNLHGHRTLIAIGSEDDEEIGDADLRDQFRRSAGDA